MERWFPHVTVATLVERDGEYLTVEEHAGGQLMLNQPAGHLEEHESLVAAAIRETQEESGWLVAPEALLGIYQWRASNGKSFIRTTFLAKAISYDADAPLDDGIARALWLNESALQQQRQRLRSPLILRSIADYKNGIRYPLDLLQSLL